MVESVIELVKSPRQAFRCTHCGVETPVPQWEEDAFDALNAFWAAHRHDRS